MINGLLEILTTKKWMMQPEALDALRQVIQQNLSGHVALENFEKKMPYRMSLVGDNAIIPMQGMAPSSQVEHSDNEPEVQKFCAIIPVCGPITRNGDACSYGSIDIRDAIIGASDQEECSGIILYINTPGGACSAIPDFKYGINYAHEAGKMVIAFVDGMAASCGMYLAALCDKRYYMNKQDQIGSIGVMAAFYTEKDGEKNKYTNETFHALYATQSPNKNKWYRDASEGDYKELQDDLDKTCEEFHADVKAACPNVKPEHLTGKMYDAEEVDGILMDGQATLSDVASMILNAGADTEGGAKNAQTSNNSIDMKNYPNTQAVLKVEELQVTEEGTFMNAALLDTLEAHLTEEQQNLTAAKEAGEKALADAKAEHEKALADAEAEAEKQVETMKDEQEKAMADAKAEADKAIEAKAQELADCNAKLEEAQKALDGANEALKTAEQQMADKDAQIKALTEAPAQQEEGSAQSNGTGAPAAGTFPTCMPAYDSTKSPLENKRIRQEYMKAHQA